MTFGLCTAVAAGISKILHVVVVANRRFKSKENEVLTEVMQMQDKGEFPFSCNCARLVLTFLLLHKLYSVNRGEASSDADASQRQRQSHMRKLKVSMTVDKSFSFIATRGCWQVEVPALLFFAFLFFLYVSHLICKTTCSHWSRHMIPVKADTCKLSSSVPDQLLSRLHCLDLASFRAVICCIIEQLAENVLPVCMCLAGLFGFIKLSAISQFHNHAQNVQAVVLAGYTSCKLD